MLESDLASYLSEDAIGRNNFLNILMKLLNGMPTPNIVALNGAWGSGKTIVARQLEWIGSQEEIAEIKNIDQSVIDKFRKRFVPYYYNAWKNDYFDDALQPLLFNLASDMLAGDNFMSQCFRNGLNGLNVAGFVKNITYDLIDFDKCKKESTVERIANDFITSSKRYSTMSDFFNKTIGSSGKKLLFIVDELDRCKPTFAVKTLECIKHFCFNENLIFLLPVNNTQLAHTVCHFYGEKFSGVEYLNRFFNYTFSMNSVDIEKYIKTKVSSMQMTLVPGKIAQSLGMTMREADRYIQALLVISDYIQSAFTQPSELERFCRGFIAPLAIAISIVRPDRSKDFNDGKDPGIIDEMLGDQVTLSSFIPIFDENFYINEAYPSGKDDHANELIHVIKKWYERALMDTKSDAELDKKALRDVISLISVYSAITQD